MKTGTRIFTLLLASVCAGSVFPQEKQAKSSIKIIKIVDGDTTITEKTLDEQDMPFVEKEVSTSKDGKNVSVKVIVSKEEGSVKDEATMKNFDFNFTFDTAGISRLFERKLIIGDSLFKHNDLEMEEMMKKLEGSMKNMDTSHAFFFGSNGGNIYLSSDSVLKIVMKSLEGLKEGKSGYMYMYSDDKDKAGQVHIATCVKIIDLDEKKEKRKKSEPHSKAPQIGKVDFYPNPNQGDFTLEFETGGFGPTQITVSDLNGKVVYSDEVTGKGYYSKRISLGENSKGIYLLKLQQGDKATTKKLIIE